MFVTALFTTAKTWKQSMCPSTDDRPKNMLYIYIYVYYTHTHTGVLFSHKNKNIAIYGNFSGPKEYYTESDNDKFYIILLICGI